MKKKFDCVAMKNEIQHNLQNRWAGLANDQRRESIRRDLEGSSSPIGELWRHLSGQEVLNVATRDHCVAEPKTRYGKK